MLYLKEMSKYLEFKRFKWIIYMKAKRLDIHWVELCINKMNFILKIRTGETLRKLNFSFQMWRFSKYETETFRLQQLLHSTSIQWPSGL